MTGQEQAPPVTERLTREARANRLFAFGTSHIFQRRATRLNTKLNLLNYIGVAIPTIVGATALSFKTDFAWFPALIYVASAVLIAQLAVSLWSINSGWVGQHAYANESVVMNDDLVRRYDELLNSSPSANQFKITYDLIAADDHSRRNLDKKHAISEKELRMGMRAALRRYQHPCATCKQVPTSLKATDCDTCGNF